jgi:hypothetical protein
LELPDVDFPGIWQDVVSTAPNGNVTARHVRAVAKRHCGHRLGTNDRRFGEPIDFRGLRHAPINELGVVFLFGIVSRELGFIVESIQAEFPDCLAKRLSDPKRNRWTQVQIEFEYRSRNFVAHQHRSEECDLIVCWIDDWPDCPIEVIALREEIDRIARRSLSAPL